MGIPYDRSVSPEGKVVYCDTGIEGRNHVFTSSHALIQTLRGRPRIERGVMLADSAFLDDSRVSLLSTPLRAPDKRVADAVALDISAWIVKRRQAMEWGIRQLSGTWRRMSTALPFNPHHWERAIETVVRLNNLRVSSMESGGEIHFVYKDELAEALRELHAIGAIGLRADGVEYVAGVPRDDDILQIRRL